MALATKWLGAAPCFGMGDVGFCRSSLRVVADARQFRAALYARIFPLADCVGQLFLPRKKPYPPASRLVLVLMLVDGRFVIGIDLIRLLVDFLVVLDVGIDGGLIVL